MLFWKEMARKKEPAMENEHNRPVSPQNVAANRQLVEQLFAKGLIAQGTREFAIGLLYPARNWALWVSRLLLAVGAALALSGIVYFFAFNWAVIEGLVKLGAVAAVLAGCLGFVHFYGLERRTGQVMLLAACVLTGVFLAVFGQVYQTGADAYTLFTAWALLILPWVGVARFAGLWVLWLGIANTAVLLWWDQAALPERDMEAFILVILAAFNGAFLCLREYFSQKREWLDGRWTRILLAAATLGCATIPGFALIVVNQMREAQRGCGDVPKRGHAVITDDEKGVAKYLRLHDEGKGLKDGEKLLRYHCDRWRMVIVPNSYMFQEGHRRHYERAKYGVFRFGEDGKSVLVGLAGEDMKIINP